MRSLLFAGLTIMMSSAVLAQTPLPFNLGGPYTLIDQRGQTRTEVDPDGQAQLVFFGYANCVNICSTALPMMAQVTDNLAAKGVAIRPVLITVAPDQDSPAAMVKPLAELHPKFVGLTGEKDALQRAYDAFSIEVTPLFEDPEYGWIYAHNSLIHLMDKDGKVLTLLPPILSADRVTEIALKYLAPAG